MFEEGAASQFQAVAMSLVDASGARVASGVTLQTAPVQYNISFYKDWSSGQVAAGFDGVNPFSGMYECCTYSNLRLYVSPII